MTQRRWWAAATAAVLLTTVTAGVNMPAGAETAPEVLAAGETGLVRMRLPDETMLHNLIAGGADLAARPRLGSEVLVDLVVSDRELRELTALGAETVQLIARERDGSARFAESVAAAEAKRRTGVEVLGRGADGTAIAADTLHFLSAYWWTTGGQTFVQTQVATTAISDPAVEITVTWRTADGTTGSYPLQRFSDAGEYQYHVALPRPLPARPVQLTATSSLGGSRTTTPFAWPGATPPAPPAGYQKDFIDAYLTPTDIRARIARLARQYPDLAEVINLPNPTQGYRRTASGYLGNPATAAIVVETVRFGDQGENGLQVRTVDPGAANRPLSAQLRDRVLTVSLATDASGAVISTTDQVAAYISARWPQRFRAFAENGSAGLPMPVAGPVRLTDGLDAPAGVPHRPWTVQALRIGVHRDGSRIGVLTYSQEHAREWATPLVTMEFAERLLANYATHAETRALLEQVDVFVLPMVNPDGANYSFYDFNFQRKNLVNHCTGTTRDPANANSWGVDINRNYAVGSMFDGFFGASANCLSGTYAGLAEESETESRNLVALARAHPNIKFGMNVHSYGGYFMWPPGAYVVPGRIPLPRPSIEESALFQASAKRIVGAISASRGTVTWPSQTGPVADVLYSAAGNSADQLYYENGIFAWDFEVGNDRWNPATQEWEAVGFQPPFTEAHAESQEYADGLFELLRVARDYAQATG
ncbi:MAG TPA: M14 family zinc carboxypeptidase [Actinophytocola sp.]|uniref:M14 family zinc carboxypeptidase n=1 Tax=Actinophytocola sp. TaxID=1872138 RepID=UPI002DB69DD5|nr:M14 family zinc carboxypeptidase [Actinophytocola sp.]HEU5472635.1 M14 family zinc carboxypeptidase [Actinophytocola sp.]